VVCPRLDYAAHKGRAGRSSALFFRGLYLGGLVASPLNVDASPQGMINVVLRVLFAASAELTYDFEGYWAIDHLLGLAPRCQPLCVPARGTLDRS